MSRPRRARKSPKYDYDERTVISSTNNWLLPALAIIILLLLLL